METITLIPSLLFRRPNLVGPLQEDRGDLARRYRAGGGHPLPQAGRIAQSVYPAGRSQRPARSPVVESTTETLPHPQGLYRHPKGWDLNSALSRFTYTLDPVPNPKLDDATSSSRFPRPSSKEGRMRNTAGIGLQRLRDAAAGGGPGPDPDPALPADSPRGLVREPAGDYEPIVKVDA